MKARQPARSAPRAGIQQSTGSGPIPDLGAIVMAAGLGKRMRSRTAKVLHPVAGRPMVLYAVRVGEHIAGRGVAVVLGHQAKQVRAVIEERPWNDQRGAAIIPVEQTQQLGTGHAVMQARSVFTRGDREPVSAYVILNGDTPLLTEATVRQLWRVHQAERATVTLLTTVLDDPSGYGRVLRSGPPSRGAGSSGPGSILGVVEDRDATPAEAQVREVNVGTYVVDGQFLFEALDKLQPNNAQKEYYLTDLVGIAVDRGLRVSAVTLHDSREGLGINSRQELAVAEQIVRQQNSSRWMAAGVTMRDPATTWIDADVVIGQDTVLYPHVALEGATSIGEDCVIRSHVRLTDCMVADRVVVQDSSVLREARLEEGATVGPFAHLRPGAVVRRNAKVGNFVEMKRSELGEGSKANHLTYLGDARIGRNVNIGAGTITCNYDGDNKYETVIEDDVFVGSDALLIAPVTVGRGALVGAGSAVTHDVPEDALAIARASQVNKPGWAARRRASAKAGAPRKGGKPASKSAKKTTSRSGRGKKRRRAKAAT